MLADYHVHTEFSDDSEYEMEEVVKHAIEIGLDEICFTDHVDYGVKLDHGTTGKIPRLAPDGQPYRNVDYPNYFAKIEMLQKKYEGQIVIKKGLEFGIQMIHLDEYEKLYETYPMDFIIHSNHQVDDVEIYLPEYTAGKTQREYNRLYYEEILRTVNAFKNYSVLGHLDSINRYDPKGALPFEEFSDLAYEILKVAISDNKGIEFNTSHVRYKVQGTTPCIEILKLYKELGGQIITIGSDSHRPEHLGFRIKETQNLLKDLGFEYFCTYEKMEPIFHKL